MNILQLVVKIMLRTCSWIPRIEYLIISFWFFHIPRGYPKGFEPTFIRYQENIIIHYHTIFIFIAKNRQEMGGNKMQWKVLLSRGHNILQSLQNIRKLLYIRISIHHFRDILPKWFLTIPMETSSHIFKMAIFSKFFGLSWDT